MRAHAIVFLALLSSCEREDEEREYADFILQIPLTITPVKDTLAVGDTLWVTADFTENLQELYSGNSYPVTPDNFLLKTNVAFLKLANSPRSLATQEGVSTNFAIVNKTGKITSRSQTFADVTYEHKQNRYHLKTGVIPLFPGIYVLNFGDGWLSSRIDAPRPDLTYLDAGTSPNGTKREFIFRSIFYYINNGNTNFHILQNKIQLASVANPSTSNTNAEKEASYTFIVK